MRYKRVYVAVCVAVKAMTSTDLLQSGDYYTLRAGARDLPFLDNSTHTHTHDVRRDNEIGLKLARAGKVWTGRCH